MILVFRNTAQHLRTSVFYKITGGVLQRIWPFVKLDNSPKTWQTCCKYVNLPAETKQIYTYNFVVQWEYGEELEITDSSMAQGHRLYARLDTE